MRLILFLLILTTLSCCSHRNDSPDTGPEPLRAENISNQFVYDIVEDTTGQIWIGTFRGLNRYNSREYYQYFGSEDSLSLQDSQVHKLLVASDGTLYVGNIAGLCRRTRNDNFRRTDISDMVSDLVEMPDGSIIVQCRPELKAYHPDADSTELLAPAACPGSFFNIRLHADDRGELWVVGEAAIRRYDFASRSLADSIPTHTYATNSYMTDGHLIWLVGNRLRLFDTHIGDFAALPPAIAAHPVLSRSRIEFVHPYGNGGLLVQTSGDGMYYFDKANDRITGQHDNGFPFDVPDFKIRTMYTDSRNNLWFGGHDQGIDVHYFYTERFNRNKTVSDALAGISVVSTAIDSLDNLWMATRHGDIYIFDKRRQELVRIPFADISPVKDIYDTTLKNIFIDSRGYIWISLTVGETIKCRYAGDRLEILERFNAWGVMSICEDPHGTIWFGTASPYVYYIRPDSGAMRSQQVFDSGFSFIPGLMNYDEDHILVAAFNKPLKLIDTGSLEISMLPHGDKDLRSALTSPSFIPTDIFRDRDGTLWIGTVSNGLIKYNPTDSTFTPVPGAACDDISAIRQDSEGLLWLSTLYGLSRYNPASDTFEHFYERDGIGGNQFYDRSCAVDSSGNIYFGGTHGITSFNPDELSRPVSAPVVFQDLLIHNRPIRPGGDIIDRDLSLLPEVRLEHDNNSFGISFVAVDYCKNPRVTYRYMLEGFDKSWVEGAGTHEAYYANIPPGKYRFRAGIVGDTGNVTVLDISVAVPWWQSWWAIALYIIAAGAVAAFLVLTSRKIRAHRMAEREARLEKERERHINDMNMRFFANISHEFRTPLTMISGPIKQLADNDDIPKGPRHLLSIANANVNRMLNLVNQLLDFNKLENDTLPLEVERIDIALLLRQIAETFANYAEGKEINFTINGTDDNCFVTADADKITKICSNLLSNALKFTPRGGSITVGLDTVYEAGKGASIKIYVRNTGRRIPSDKLEKIFERYYQLDSNKAEGSYSSGSGIGLYYSRALATLHHGRLYACDDSTFEGAEFVLIIPAEASAYAGDTHKSGSEQKIEYPTISGLPDDNEPDSDKALILVVDNDIQVAEYLKALLCNYKVVTRFDADSALEWLEDNMPSLIISDVVMPGTDGYELCRTVKHDVRFCHIPLILLTAKVTAEDQVTGLEAEADAYVTKPFEPVVLMSQIGSLLRNRERARHMITTGTTVENVDEDMISAQDNKFLTELYSLIEKELSDPETDVNEIARLMGMSRTKFYYKVKGLTGEPPSVFVKTYKLNRAAELIKEHRYTMSEISDKTGFSSLSHFSRSFKKQFGIAPSAYE